MGKKAKLADIIQCCELRFNRGDAAQWKDSDLLDLNREIQRGTDVNISLNTLKRIFGKIAVDEDYVPQQATLDALKKYGRYVEPTNPQPVVSPTVQPQPEPLPVTHPQSELPPIEQPITVSRKSNFSRFNILFTTIIVIIVIASFFTWRLLQPKNISGTIKIIRIEGHLPATAFFELQSSASNDSLFVNFGDKSPLVPINPGQKNAAHIYYIPGVFNVSIQTRHQAIATTSAYIPSNNWVGLVFHNQQEIPDHFYAFPAIRTGSDSLFQVTNRQLATMGLDTTGVILTRFCNYTSATDNADEFVFDATFKNVLPEKSNYCRGTQFQISGSNSMIRFKLVSPGCSLRVINMVSEQTFNGATTDLSQFVFDLENWNRVKLVNHKKRVSLYINGKQIFNGPYQRSLGDIRGVFLEFEGAGFVKNCTLKSYDEKMLYHF